MQLIVDLNDRAELIETKDLIEQRLEALADTASVEELAREAVGRMGHKGRRVLKGMLEQYGADKRFTLKDASQTLRTPYDELRNVQYRSIGRVLDRPLMHKRWNGSENEYWFEADARTALLTALV
ncbi:MAG TPA: hypothetical protein VGX28_06285 [Frankiaceae bacterium]|jgi:hypothetical protein|nr:hypothetical protein [Frankiaceae bacterium]